MKQIVRVVALLALLSMVHGVLAVQAGDTTPAWEARNIDGKNISFPGKGEEKTTVLVFWATWCPYCQVFMPYLPGIESDYRDRGVQVMAINIREEEDADPAAYIRSYGYTFDTFARKDEIAGLYSVHYIPGLLVIGKDGKVVYRRKSTDLPAGREVAEFWDSEVRTVLDEYLD